MGAAPRHQSAAATTNVLLGAVVKMADAQTHALKTLIARVVCAAMSRVNVLNRVHVRAMRVVALVEFVRTNIVSTIAFRLDAQVS